MSLLKQAVILERNEWPDTQSLRVQIRNALEEHLQKESDVLALAEFGSRAVGTHDELSDMDFLCIVAAVEGKENEEKRAAILFTILKNIFEKELGMSIELEHEDLWEECMGNYQRFLRFKSTGENPVLPTLLIDFSFAFKAAMWKKFSTPEQHGIFCILFDKKNLISPDPPEFDVEKHAENMMNDLKSMITRFGIFQSYIGKELLRNHHLGARYYYDELTLNPLVQVLNMKYQPLRYFFKLRYAHHFGFPQELIETLESLYFVATPQELCEKQKIAVELFYVTVDEILARDNLALLEDLAKNSREAARNAFRSITA